MFKDLSIQRKLLVLALLSSGISLVLACLGFVLYDLSLLKKSLIEETTSLTKQIARLNTAAIDFNDPGTAEETLSAMGDSPHIMAAAIYKTGPTPFALFLRKDQGPNFRPPTPQGSGHFFTSEYLDVFQPVILNNEQVGIAFVRSDLAQLNKAVRKYIYIGTGVLLISFATAFLVSVKLQKVISRPILDLALTTQQVSATKDYSLRVAKTSRDEIGQLIDGFNEMLRQLQVRDAELLKARDQLELRVEERTRELQLEILERKRAEESIRAVARKLEISNRELQDFAYVASHDLQEPLRKVQAFGDRLKLKYAPQLGPEGADFLDRMQNAAKRMQVLINDLLAFSRVTTKANPFQMVDLNQVLKEVASDLEVRLQQTNGRIEKENLPTIQADPVQMRQLLQNLLSNALKFHKPEEPPVVIVRSTILPPEKDGEGSKCEIQVADNGIGFDEKYLDRIFTVFQRLHGRGVYEGTGIGLAICRKIVDRHGGTISARSKPGLGAAFIVTLPVEQTKERS